MNLYGFVGNDGLSGIDFLGQWIIDRKFDFRASAIAEPGDTVDGLAKQIKFDGFDYRDWLKPVMGTKMPQNEFEAISCGKFTIPNTVYFDRGPKTHPQDYLFVSSYSWCVNVAEQYATAYYFKGFRIIITDDVGFRTAQGHLIDRDLYAYVYGGHGGGSGNIAATQIDSGLAPERLTNHGISTMVLISCDSATGINLESHDF